MQCHIFTRRFNLKCFFSRYSQSKDGAYCSCCFVFGTDQESLEFASAPFRDWKNAIGEKRGALRRHNESRHHHQHAEMQENFLRAAKSGSVQTQLNQEIKEQIRSNTEVLKILTGIVLLGARRGFALRGNWSLERKEEDSNFMALVHWTAKFSPELALHLSRAPRNATYTSPRIQNEILGSISEAYRKRIVERLHSESKFFSLLVDEVTDVSKQEQMGLCVRYIAGGEVHEDFLGFVEVNKTDAETLTNTIMATSQAWNLPLERLRGKGFDGAANMIGHKSGVSVRIEKLLPQAKYTTHCRAHCLNLVVVEACKVNEIKNFMNKFRELTFFLNYSPKRKPILKAKMGSGTTVDLLGLENEEEIELFRSSSRRHVMPSLCETRWLARVDSVSCLLANYQQVLAALEDVEDQSSGQASSDAESFLLKLKQFATIFSAVCTQSVLAYLRPLSLALQNPSSDLLAAHEHAKLTLSALKSKRNTSEHFDSIYDRALRLGRAIHGDNFQPSQPRAPSRAMHRANAAAETPQQYYKVNVYLPFLDAVISHLDDRFSEGILPVLKIQNLLDITPEKAEELQQAFSKEMPEASSFLAEAEKWRLHCVSVGRRLSLLEALVEAKEEMFPNIHTLLSLLLCLPVTTCDVERSFSALKRVKTAARSSMGEERLNGLALPYVHRDMEVTEDDVLRIWAPKGERRMRTLFTS